MKYYLHDSNAFSDEKITELFIKFGYEGLGLFYTILEKIASQEKPIKTNVLKSQLKVGKKLEKCWLFMESLGIICSNNGETFSETLLNFSEKYSIKKEKNKKRIQEWRDNQDVIKNVTRYKSVRNAPKVNRSKVNRSKEKENKETKKFVSPTLLEFEKYFEENGYRREVAERAWTGYSVAEWHDSTGKKVLNWKQKCQNVWFRPENKIIPKNEVQKINPQHDFSMKISGIENTFLTRCEGYRHNYGKEPPQEWFDKFNEANGTNLQPKKEPISA